MNAGIDGTETTPGGESGVLFAGGHRGRTVAARRGRGEKEGNAETVLQKLVPLAFAL